MLLVRYLDVALVAITVPVLLLAGLPALGVLVGGGAWIVALAIVAAGLAGSREDGATAAALVLAAFTVYFVMTAFGRSLERKPTTT